MQLLAGPSMTPSNQHTLTSGTSLIRTRVSLGIAPTIEKGYPYKEFPQGCDRGFEAGSLQRRLGNEPSAAPLSSAKCPRFRCRHPFRTNSVTAPPLEPRPGSDATLIRVEADNGLTGIGAALGAPPIVEAIENELPPECVGGSPMFSERI